MVMNRSSSLLPEQAKKIHLGVIFGGRSGEHAVSLMSARSVLNVLDLNRYEIIPIGITQDGRWVSEEIPRATGRTSVLEALQADLHHPEGNAIAALIPVTLLPEPSRSGVVQLLARINNSLVPLAELDAIFPVLHGTFGEDGTLQGLFELTNIAYVGAGVLASSVGMDKGLFKDVMRAYRLPTPEYHIVTRQKIETQMDQVLDEAEGVAAYPLFVKPVNLGSSVGVSKCRNRSDLLEGLLDAARYDRRVLIERGINAREIEISVLGNEDPIASIPGEIRPGDEFYTYQAKYLYDTSELLIPAPLEPGLAIQMQNIAIQVYKAVDCAGMARVDFLLDRDTNQPYISEINTIPGFTQISMYPKLWEASGLPYPRLVNRLVELAFERKRERDRTEYIYGGSA